MARLFLHIGGHKTGTSYIQGLFHDNQRLLQTHGVQYPPTYPYQAHHQLARFWVTQTGNDPHWHLSRSPEQMWADVLDPRLAQGPDTVFLSSEVFSHFTAPRVDMADLAACLSVYEEVRVIYAMRAQTELLNSVWIERVKKCSPIWPRKFVEQALESRRAFGAALDHHAFYHHLRTGFAPEQIILLDYHAACRAPGGLGQWFLDILETGLSIGALQPPPLNAQNISPDAISLWLATQIHRDGPPPPVLIQQVAAILYGAQSRPSTILSEVEHARVQSKFRDGNARLAEIVNAVQPDFSFAPPPPPDDLLYRNQLPATIWPDIAAALWSAAPLDSKRSALDRVVTRFSEHFKGAK